MHTKLVSNHQYQLSTFFCVIRYMPVKAAALAKASAKGMVSGEKYFFSKISEP